MEKNHQNPLLPLRRTDLYKNKDSEKLHMGDWTQSQSDWLLLFKVPFIILAGPSNICVLTAGN